jgi:CBS domain-containing protein
MLGGSTFTLTHRSVSEAMHEGVYTCPPDTPLSEVAEIMVARGVHALVVRRDPAAGEGAPGMISALDLVAAATIRSLDEQAAAGSVASPAVTVTPDVTLARAAQLMTRHGTAHLLVVDENAGLPVGVLSTMDILEALAAADESPAAIGT